MAQVCRLLGITGFPLYRRAGFVDAATGNSGGSAADRDTVVDAGMIYAGPAPGAVVARTDVETFAATPDADAREVAAADADVVAAFALLVGLSVHDPFCSTTSLRCTFFRPLQRKCSQQLLLRLQSPYIPHWKYEAPG